MAWNRALRYFRFSELKFPGFTLLLLSLASSLSSSSVMSSSAAAAALSGLPGNQRSRGNYVLTSLTPFAKTVDSPFLLLDADKLRRTKFTSLAKIGLECTSDNCRPCDQTSYEISPCRQKSSRRCMNVALPVSLSSSELTDLPANPTFMEGLEAEASSNVILENLHNTRNLGTTYYVTDATQASDFYWDRESGLRVNIGILNVHLIPEYEDVDHDGGDNKYMLSNPNNVEDKIKYQTIMRQFCRYPIPDHYSITLEISRDRTTTAKEVRCSSTSGANRLAYMKCLERHRASDAYIERDINEACHKMGTFPEPLTPAANSIVCTENTSLLRDLFNQSYSVERSIRFPTKKCRSAISRCEQCINQARCSADNADRKCCQIDCYTLIDCKLAFSHECTSASVECAMGDAYRYTLQPMFHGLRADSQCHVRRRKLDVIYELFFFVQLPPSVQQSRPGYQFFSVASQSDASSPSQTSDRTFAAGAPSESPLFQTPKVYRTVRSGSDRRYWAKGIFTADYLTVEHSAGLELNDELIVRRHDNSGSSSGPSGSLPGNRGSSTRPSAAAYTVRPAFYDDAISTGSIGHVGGGVRMRPSVHEISKNIYVVSTQFERPFDYSTTTWTSSDDCNKNETKMRPAIRHNVSNEQTVSTIIQTANEPYRYFFKSVDNPPYIRFMVPGNTSILPYYFTKNSPTLRLDETLDVTLHLTSFGSLWEFRIAGLMTGCPSYVSIVIINHADSEELFRYDALVLCPPSFNVTFRVPRLSALPPLYYHQHPGPFDYEATLTTFEVRFSDPVQIYSVFLTHFQPEHDSDVVGFDDAETAYQERNSEAIVDRPAMTSFPVLEASTIFAILSGVVLVSVLVLTVALIQVDPMMPDGVRRLRLSVASWWFNSRQTLPFHNPPVGYSYCNSTDTPTRLQAVNSDGVAQQSTPAKRNSLPAPPARAEDSVSKSQQRNPSATKPPSPSTIRALVLVYASLWIFFSLTATFTVLSLTVTVVLRQDFDRLQLVAENFRFRSDRNFFTRCNGSNRSSSGVDRFRMMELHRQATQVVERRLACATHVDKLFESRVAELAWTSAQVLSTTEVDSSCSGRRLSAVGKRLASRYMDRAAIYGVTMSNYEAALRSRVESALGRYLAKHRAYLKAVADSPWTSPAASSMALLNDSRFSVPAMDSTFSAVFEVDEVDVVHRWPQQFWQRYARLLPDLPSWPPVDDLIDDELVRITSSQAEAGCGQDDMTSSDRLQRIMSSATGSTFNHLFDSTRYMVTYESSDANSGNSFRHRSNTSPSHLHKVTFGPSLQGSNLNDEFYLVRQLVTQISGTDIDDVASIGRQDDRKRTGGGGGSDGPATASRRNQVKNQSTVGFTSTATAIERNVFWIARLLFLSVDGLMILFHLTRAYLGYRRLLFEQPGCEETEQTTIDPVSEHDESASPLPPPPPPVVESMRNGGAKGFLMLPVNHNHNNHHHDHVHLTATGFDDSRTEHLVIASWNDACSNRENGGAVGYLSGNASPSTAMTSLRSYSPLHSETRDDIIGLVVDNRSTGAAAAPKQKPEEVRSLEFDSIIFGLLSASGRVVCSRSLLPLLCCAALLTASHVAISMTYRLERNRIHQYTDTGRAVKWSEAAEVVGGDIDAPKNIVDELVSLYTAASRYHVTVSNMYVSWEKRHLYDEVLLGSLHHVTNELLNLQAYVVNFNAERHRLAESFAEPWVSTQKVNLTGNGCDVTRRLMTPSNSPPLVPCNYIPSELSVIKDDDICRFETELFVSLWQLLDTIRRLIVRTAYAILAAMTTVFVLRAVILIVSRRLAITSSRCRQRYCIGSDTTAVADAINNCCRPTTTDDVTDGEDGADGEEYNENNENDDADDVIGATSSPSPQLSFNSMVRAPAQGTRDMIPSSADFKYIETKV